MKNKVAIYCRVSTQMQSTDRQKEELLTFAKEHNYIIDEENIYIDIITGYSVGEERPKYSEMLDNIEKGNITTILFSELTRLGRNSVELLAEIQRLQEKKIELYFQRQDLWIRDKQDLGSRILLAVLAITTSYEIELFAERSISGKINKIHNGGGVGGDQNSYGYRNNENKIMVIREDEAEIVRRIFTLYANGKSTIEICDILNAEKIPTAYETRTKEFAEKRKQKGLPPKQYLNYNPDELFWRPNVVSRLLSKKLYTGHRHVEFHKPQLDKSKKNEPSEIIHTYDVQVENLRIISDELFNQAQEQLLKAHYNKNISIKHDNLLKHKLVCGECGSNFSVGKSTETAKNYISGGRSYKCYGRVNRKDKPRTCEIGAEVRQWKLDGLVLSLSLFMFAEININEANKNKIEQLDKEVLRLQQIKRKKEDDLDNITSEYKRTLRRLSKLDDNDDVIFDLINEEKQSFTKKQHELHLSISKYQNEISNHIATIQKLQRISDDYMNLQDKMHEIRNSKELVRNMIDEYIDKIFIYKIHKFWNLVVVKYTTGAEFWGTIKSARYKIDEMFYDELTCKYGIEFHSWFLNNSDNSFSYDKTTKTIYYNGTSEIYKDFKEGEYSFDEMNKLIYDTKWIGSFPFYIFEDNTTPPQIFNTDSFKKQNESNNIDWAKHNEDVLKRISRKHR